jgi:transcriptional regulator with XRE-family HTH domain
MAGKKEPIEVEISEMDLFVINKVREMRVQKELSQVDLSIMLGMSEGTVGKIENPKLRDKYNIRHINLLAKALRCSPKDLFPEKPLPNDVVLLKLRHVKQPASAKDKPNYEIISKSPVAER